MGKIFYIGDWHYGHANIIAYDNRPFRDVQEMDEALVRKWNSKVQDGDTVYVLGDMFWRPRDAADVMGRLKGDKVLVRGNHDNGPSDGFTQVASYLEVADNGRLVVLCHYPVLGHRDMFRGAVHLYAHVHTGYDWHILEDTKARLEALYERPIAMYNAGAMMPWMGYEPRTLDEIQAGYLAWKAQMEAMGPASRPEIDRMLTLSTAHVSEGTARMLDEEPDANRLGLAVYRKAGTPDGEGVGWYVYLPAHGCKGIPDDLHRCLEFARSLGCRILCLDTDGNEEPSLPVHDW